MLTLIREHRGRIDGIKISLLDEDREIALRRRLPPGVHDVHRRRLQLCRADRGRRAGHHSHALLGIFDPIAPAAAAALQALGGGDRAASARILEPTVPLSRKIFEAPTQYYKAGVVFLAWLNGHQDHFAMVGGMQSARSALHYAEVFRLADQAGLLRDPELAAARMASLMALHGIGVTGLRGSACRIAGRGRARWRVRSSRRSSRPDSRGTSRWRPWPCRPSTWRSPSRR